MKKIDTSKIIEKMHSVLKAKDYSETDIPFIINMYLGGELRGHTSHGLASFVSFAQSEPEVPEEPVVLKDTHAPLALDAKGASGNVIGKRAADEAIKRAKAEGVGTVLIKDMDSWLRPGAIAEYIADQGYLAMVVNSGLPASSNWWKAPWFSLACFRYTSNVYRWYYYCFITALGRKKACTMAIPTLWWLPASITRFPSRLISGN